LRGAHRHTAYGIGLGPAEAFGDGLTDRLEFGEANAIMEA
jgi:hypothetical protein